MLKKFLPDYKKCHSYKNIGAGVDILPLVAGVGLISCMSSIAFCGSTPTENTVTVLQDIIRNMSQQDLEEFQRQLRFEPQAGWDDESQNVASSNNRWHSVAIFVVGTFVLVILSTYGNDIIDLINEFGRLSVQSVQTLGEMTVSRQLLFQEATRMLNTPEGQQRVINALRMVELMRVRV